jgi:folate-binding protein YgfZ
MTSYFSDLSEIGLLRISGIDAASFLHNLLSSHVKKLSPGQGGLSTLNSAKGRVIADFFLWRAADNANGEPVFYAVLAADLADTVTKKLKMYVLRAKVAVDNLSADSTAIGVFGDNARENLTKFTENSLNDGNVVEKDGIFFVAYPKTRALIVGTPDKLNAVRDALSATLTSVSRQMWDKSGILDAVPLITAATSEKFIAQEINMDELGAVDFEKGCYTGQEIIARTRYLGRLKTKLFIAVTDADAPVAAGAAIFGTTFGDQACGTVVNAAPENHGQVLLVNLQIAAQDDALRLENGATLRKTA